MDVLSRMLPQPVDRFAMELAQEVRGGTTAEFRQRVAQRVAVVRRELAFAFAVAREPSILAQRRLSAMERQEIIRLADDRLAFFGTVLSGVSSHRCDASQVP